MFIVISLLCLGFLEAHEHMNYNYDYALQLEVRPQRDRVKSDQWCSLSCVNDRKNIACIHSNRQCVLQATCVLIKLDTKEILAKHNDLRSKFATGAEEAAGGVKVSNMMGLKWEDDLAYTAQCNLVDCGDVKEDACHRTPLFDTVGQNVWSFTDRETVDCENKALEGIQSWYDEVKQTSPEQLAEDSKFYKGNVKTKHFAQIIWATTAYVGCAMTQKAEMGYTKCKLTCNYAPGLQRDSRAFHEGAPCGECPESYCQENGLCWLPEELMKRGSTNSKLQPNACLLIMSILFVHKTCNK